MLTTIRTALALFLLLLTAVCFAANNDAPQSAVKPASAVQLKYPKIVLYSVSWCPHCKDAKEYFTKNNIPFINKDVELDEAAMDELTKKYKSQGVPVIVIGNDGSTVLKGFDPVKFENAMKNLKK
jgi:glutaredoxin-like YruB-family protein